MKNFILYGHSGSGNHGCEAIVRATQKILGGVSCLFSHNPEQDIHYGIDCRVLRHANKIQQKSIRRYFYALYSRFFKKSMKRCRYVYSPFLDAVETGKTYLSIGGDHYCYGESSNRVYNFLNNSIKNKGGKSVLWSCSIENNDMNAETVESLKRYDLITARESITYENLRAHGICDNVVLVPDVAFVLDVKETNLPEIFQKNEVVGINISPMILKYGDNAVFENYVKLIELILEKTNCSIALIPHVVWADSDDRVPLRKLFEIFKDYGRIALIEDMPAEQLKFVISKCSFFVGARTHATIAAYSSCVPTLVVGYSVKARGIARDVFGDEADYVVSAQSMKKEFLLADAFWKNWQNRNATRTYLHNMMPEYSSRVWKSKEMIESKIR